MLIVLFGTMSVSISYAATSVSGNIPSSHWTLTGSPYTATADVTIPSGQTLIIDAGVIVKMSPSSNFNVNGVLQSNGTSASPVIFSSLQEGTAGAAPGQWANLSFNGVTSATTLANTIIRYGAQVSLSGSSPQLNAVTISSMSLSAMASDLASSPTGSGNTAVGSPFNCNQWLSGNIANAQTWNNLGFPDCSLSGEIIVGSGGSLTLGAGLIVKSYNNSSFAVVNGGTLISHGTAANPVVFTSLLDDSVGGDTNNDQTATQPYPGGWGGLEFIRANPASDVHNLTLRYGGYGAPLDANLTAQGMIGIPAIDILESSITVSGLNVSFNAGSGIDLDMGSTATITGSIIRGNYYEGINSNGSLSVINSTVTENMFNAFAMDPTASHLTLKGNAIFNNANDGIGLYSTSVNQPNNGEYLSFPVTINNTVQFSTQTNQGLPYVVDEWDLEIGVGGTLILGPGIVLKSIASGIIASGGKLISQGTSAHPVIMTSLLDDSIDGDTNNDGTQTLPSPGDWNGLQISGSSGNQITNTVISYAWDDIGVSGASVTITNVQLSSSADAGLEITGASNVTLVQSVVSGGIQDGVSVDGGRLSTSGVQVSDNGNNAFNVTSGSTVTIQSCLLQNNYDGVWSDSGGGSLTVTGSTITANPESAFIIDPSVSQPSLQGNTITNNGVNGFSMESVTLHNKVQLLNQNQGLPYVIGILFSGLTVGTGGELNLGPGVIVKADGEGFLEMANGGTLTTQGTSIAPVVFTSIEDDSVGGDTFNDGASTPNPGDWGGITYYWTQSQALTNLQILYGYTPIQVIGSTLTIDRAQINSYYGVGLGLTSGSNVILTNSVASAGVNSAVGIELDSGSKIAISSSTISNNAIGLLNDDVSNASIHYSAFQGNVSNGIVNNNAAINLNAGFNYWGSTTGPSAVANPGGTGDHISGPVTFVPYWTSPSGGTLGGGATTTAVGRILDAFGNPISQLTISLLDDTVQTVTDSSGHFTQSDLSTLDGFVTLSATATVGGVVMTARTSRFVNTSGTTSFGDVLLSVSSSTISGDLSGTLSALNNPYVVTGDIDVPAGHTLTLEPDVIIKMGSSFNFTIDGSLVSLGVSTAPVIITSLQDSSVGGDTLHNQSQGAPGDWNSLTFNNATTPSRLQNTVIRFGQQITLTNASPQLNGVTISSMSAAAMVSDLASLPTGTGNKAFGSPYNCEELQSGSISGALTWGNLGFPYCMVSGGMTIAAGGHLTLSSGVIIKSSGGGTAIAVNGGTLTSLGVSTSPVILTSVLDDSVGGDTNNDGAGSAPGPGQCGDIVLKSATSPRLSNIQLRYGSTPLQISGSTITIDNVQISSYSSAGIQIIGGSSVTVTNSVASGGYYGILDDGGILSANQVRVLNNIYRGFEVASGSTATIQSSLLQGSQRFGLLSYDGGGNTQIIGSTITANLQGAIAIDPSVTQLKMQGNSIYNNGANGIVVQAATLNNNVQWQNMGYPYVLNQGAVTVASGGHLSLSPGVIIKSSGGGTAIAVNGGTLTSLGVSTSPVILTSVLDDSVGGDTNNDGASSAPGPGQCGDIVLNSAASPRLSNIQLHYGSNSLQISGSTITIDNVQISSYSSAAIRIIGGSSVTVTNSVASGGYYGILDDGGILSANQVQVLNNIYRGFEVASGSTATIQSSLLQGSQGVGLLSYDGGGNIQIIGSTITANLQGAISVDPSVTQLKMQGNNIYNNGANGILVQAATLNNNVQWQNMGYPYVLNQGVVAVGPGGHLSLSPGVIIKSSVYGGTAIEVNGGTLTSLGVSTNPVIITSLADDSAGGDTNNDGATSIPMPGQASDIAFNSTTSPTLSNIQFRYGHDPLQVNGSTLTIDNVQVSSYSWVGIYIQGGSSVTLTNSVAYAGYFGVVDDGGLLYARRVQTLNNIYRGFEVALGSTATIQSCLLKGSQNYGLVSYDGGGNAVIIGSTITANSLGAVIIDPSMTQLSMQGNNVYGNGVNGIVVQPATLQGNYQWSVKDLPYVINQGLNIVLGGRLALSPGVIIKSNNTSTVISVNGGDFVSQGVSTSPVIVTSLEDDSVGGDTNNDGTASTPSPGQTSGLSVNSTSLPKISNIQFRYGVNPLQITGSTVTIDSVQISSYSGTGIILDGGSNATLTKSVVTGGLNTAIGVELYSSSKMAISSSTITRNGGGLINNDFSNASIHYSNIQQNVIKGVVNNNTGLNLDATYNYWGSSTGPTAVGNPGGTGDAVTTNVKYIPFWTTPTGGVMNGTDVLPPRTKLAVGSPHVTAQPVVISTGTPLSLSVVDDRSAVGDGQGVGVSSSQYAVDGATFSLYTTPFFIVQAGTHTVRMFSVDLSGNVELTTSTVVLVDTAAPVTQISYNPAAYVNVSSRTFVSGSDQIGFTAVDSTAPVASTQYRVDPGTATLFQTLPHTFALGEGSHSIQFQSQDVLGNLESVRSVSVSVDTTPPTSYLTVLSSHGVLSNGTVLITTQTFFVLTGTDTLSKNVVSGLKDIQVSIDTAAYSVYTSSFVILAAGGHSLQWFARDNVLNQESVHSLTVAQSTTALPVTTLAYVGPYRINASSQIYVSTQTLIGFSVDTHGIGLSSTLYRVDGSSATALKVFVSSFTLAEGPHHIQVQSKDVAGHLEPLETYLVDSDGTPPLSQVSISTPSVRQSSTTLVIAANSTPISFTGTDVSSNAVASGFQNAYWSLDTGSFALAAATITLPTEGVHQLHWYGQDAVQNAEVVHSTPIAVDATNPITQIVFTPQAGTDYKGQVWLTTATLVRFDGSDPIVSGVAAGFDHTDYRVDASTSGSAFQTFKSSFTLLPGFHAIDARSTDRVANVEATRSWGVRVSTANIHTLLSVGNPSVKAADASIIIGTQTALSFIVSKSAGVTIANTQYSLDGSAFALAVGSLTVSAAGTHDLKWFSQSAAGDIEGLNDATLKVDVSPPTLQIFFSPRAAVSATTVAASTFTTILIDAEDTPAGIASTLFRVDAASATAAYLPYLQPVVLGLGAHKLEVISTDLLHQSHTLTPVQVNVSTSAPTSPALSTSRLPDGATLIAGISAISPLGPSASTVYVSSVALTPAPPLTVGPVLFTIQFSSAMNTSTLPIVQWTPSGSTTSVTVTRTSYSGNLWTGSSSVVFTTPNGPAALFISGAADTSGKVIAPSVTTFDIAVPPVTSAPQTPSVAFVPTSGQLQISWQPPATGTAVSYKLYAAATPFTIPSAATLIKSGLTSLYLTDTPSPDHPAINYAVSAVNSANEEGPLSTAVSFPLPLPVVLMSPTSNSFVGTTVTVQGLGQVGAVVEISIDGNVVSTSAITAGGGFNVALALSPGSYNVQVVNRSSVTKLAGPASSARISVIVPPAPVTGLGAAPGNGYALLNWTASSDPLVAGYRLYRNNQLINGSLVARTQTSYSDGNLQNGIPYTYTLTAVDVAGQESVPSSPVTITPVATSGQRSLTPASDGGFTFQLLSPGIYALSATDSAGRQRTAPLTVVLSAAGEVESRDLTYIGLGTVTGRVIASDASNTANLVVTLQSRAALLAGSWQVLTDAAGYYTFTGIPVGPFSVSAANASEQTSASATGNVTADGQTVTADLFLTKGGNNIGAPTASTGTVQGVVLAADAATAIPGMLVDIYDPNTAIVLSEQVTSPDGRYASGVVTWQTPIVHARVMQNGLPIADQSGTFTPAAPDLTLNLKTPLGVLSGTVTYSGGTPPVAYPHAFLTQTSGGVPVTLNESINDAGGNFVIPGTVVGNYSLLVMDPTTGLEAISSGTISNAAAPLRLLLHLPPTASVIGSVVDALGKADGGAAVALVSAGVAFTRSTQTALSGQYGFDKIAVGTVTVQACDEKLGTITRCATAANTLTSPGPLTLNLVMPSTGSVSGTIFDVGGSTPVAGAAVTVQSLDNVGPLGQFSASLLSDSLGRYVAANVPYGRVLVTASGGSSGQTGTTAGVLKAPGTVSVPVTLGLHH